MALAAAAYPLMFLVFAFVDIAWGIRPLLMLGLCFAICSDFRGDETSFPGAATCDGGPNVDRAGVRIAA